MRVRSMEPDMTDDVERVPGIPDQVDPAAVEQARAEQQAERDRDEAIANGWLDEVDPGDPLARTSGRPATRILTDAEEREYRA